MASCIVMPDPVTTSEYPDRPASFQSPSSSLTSPMWIPLRFGFLNSMVASSEYFLKAFSSSNGKGGTAMTTPTW